MKLSIITINYNNAEGLRRTMESVLQQTAGDIEYIVVDGNASLNSQASPPTPLLKERGEREVRGTLKDIEVIRSFIKETHELQDGFQRCTWGSGVEGGYYSESDKGIYNAMNKGIQMAKGEYLQFLNSGDVLAAPDVTARMLQALEKLNSNAVDPDTTHETGIIYGNMIKQGIKARKIDKGSQGKTFSMLDFYRGTLNHSPAYIRRSLFDRYGLYDETLKIVSDWKWYLQVIALHNIQPRYVNIDVTVFDMTGISNTHPELDKAERKKVLSELLPESVLIDYEKYAFPNEQLERLNRYWLTRKIFWFVERVLFKWEKWRQ